MHVKQNTALYALLKMNAIFVLKGITRIQTAVFVRYAKQIIAPNVVKMVVARLAVMVITRTKQVRVHAKLNIVQHAGKKENVMVV